MYIQIYFSCCRVSLFFLFLPQQFVCSTLFNVVIVVVDVFFPPRSFFAEYSIWSAVPPMPYLFAQRPPLCKINYQKNIKREGLGKRKTANPVTTPMVTRSKKAMLSCILDRQILVSLILCVWAYLLVSRNWFDRWISYRWWSVMLMIKQEFPFELELCGDRK